jgi:hypothetical protein
MKPKGRIDSGINPEMTRLKKKFTAILVLPLSIGFGLAPDAAGTFVSAKTAPQTSSPNKPVGAPRCKAAGEAEISISCKYKAAPRAASQHGDEPRMVLLRATLSFGTVHESFLLINLTLENQGLNRISETRQVYLAIDDDAGHNHVRRVLPHVDFSKLAPGQRLTFSDRFLIGGFPAGHYTVQLWIPDPDPSLKFDPAHNFLLSSAGVADPTTGLNTLAEFIVKR